MAQGYADGSVVITKYADRNVYDASYLFTADALATDVFSAQRSRLGKAG
jgi:polyhydroxyalkanoate synthesis regulator protein